MADNKDQDKDKKRSNRTTKTIYYRCVVCGARKQETEMITVYQQRSLLRSGMCQECCVNQGRKYADGKGTGASKHTKNLK